MSAGMLGLLQLLQGDSRVDGVVTEKRPIRGLLQNADLLHISLA